jgi:hypothetical protein
MFKWGRMENADVGQLADPRGRKQKSPDFSEL